MNTLEPRVNLSLQDALDRIRPVDPAKEAAVQARLDAQTKPRGSLGRLEEFARRYVAITGRESIGEKVIFTCAGDHGVTEEGISAFPREVTPQMVLNFLDGGAGINALARHAGAEVIVVDMGVDYDFPPVEGLLQRKIRAGTDNFVRGAAMSRKEAVRALETGLELMLSCRERQVGLVGTGDMGIGNTTPSSAIAAALTGLPAAQVTHRGTGIDDGMLARKIAVIETALERNAPDPRDPIDVLAKVGGFEIGCIAGIVLGGAALSIPVVVDGFISTAGALIASELHPDVRDYIFAAHRSVEVGHGHLLERIDRKPMLDLDMRLGEGTGAALAMTLVEASMRMLREIRTFDEAGVSREKQE